MVRIGPQPDRGVTVPVPTQATSASQLVIRPRYAIGDGFEMTRTGLPLATPE
jgi:hypothetical protein